MISRDLTDSKTALIEENSRRCNCPNIRIETFDALEPYENMIGKADVVYADLPCSGLGILGKKRDIRYRMNPEQMEELVELQQKILSVIWQYVKPGGTLMYSTCTIHRAENEQMVQWFTQNFPFERQSMKEHLPEDCNPAIVESLQFQYEELDIDEYLERLQEETEELDCEPG